MATAWRSPEPGPWSAVPLPRTSLPSAFGLQKWDYWAIWDDTLLVCLAVTDEGPIRPGLRYVRLFSSDRSIEPAAIVEPFASRVAQGDRAFDPARWERGGERLSFDRDGADVTLKCEGALIRADLRVHEVDRREVLDILVPWPGGRFQHNVKAGALAASGTLEFHGKSHTFDPAKTVACLDFGRGHWPTRQWWFWGHGAAIVDGRRLALNVGAGWTDRTGETENALFVDGRTWRIPGDVRFDPGSVADPSVDAGERDPGFDVLMKPWTIRSREGDAVELVFTPLPTGMRRVDWPVRWIPGMQARQVFGDWSGRVTTPEGTVRFEKARGWAEHVRVRWGL